MPTAEWATFEHDFCEPRFSARSSAGSISVRGVIVDGTEVSSVGGDGDDGSWSDAAALLPAIERVVAFQLIRRSQSQGKRSTQPTLGFFRNKLT